MLPAAGDPEPSAQRIQHDLHRGVCGCGREHIADWLPGVPDAPLTIGPQLRALAVYLVVYQHVPVGRCRELIAGATGARVSDGFIHSCLRKAADLRADVIKLMKTLITAAHVPVLMRPRSGAAWLARRCTSTGRSPSSSRCSSWRRQPGIDARLGICRSSPVSWSLTGS